MGVCEFALLDSFNGPCLREWLLHNLKSIILNDGLPIQGNNPMMKLCGTMATHLRAGWTWAGRPWKSSCLWRPSCAAWLVNLVLVKVDDANQLAFACLTVISNIISNETALGLASPCICVMGLRMPHRLPKRPPVGLEKCKCNTPSNTTTQVLNWHGIVNGDWFN